MSSVTITLPWPPSVNHYWKPRGNGKGMYISEQGKRFRDEVGVAVVLAGKPTFDSPVAISIVTRKPDKRRRDLDNIVKATFDALTHAGVIADDDDAHVPCFGVSVGSPVDRGAVDVTITEVTNG